MARNSGSFGNPDVERENQGRVDSLDALIVRISLFTIIDPQPRLMPLFQSGMLSDLGLVQEAMGDYEAAQSNLSESIAILVRRLCVPRFIIACG